LKGKGERREEYGKMSDNRNLCRSKIVNKRNEIKNRNLFLLENRWGGGKRVEKASKRESSIAGGPERIERYGAI